MTSKTSLAKLMLSDMRHRIWIACLSAIIFLFALPISAIPVTQMLERELLDENVVNAVEGASVIPSADTTNYIMDFLLRRNISVCMLMALGACLLAVLTFSYLFSRNKTDYYHALPIVREKLFFVRFFDTILLFILPYYVMTLAALAILSSCVPLGFMLPFAIKGLIINTLSFFMMYSVALAAVMLTGQIVVAFLGVGVFFFYFPVLGIILGMMHDTYFKTFAGSIDGTIYDKILYISPATVYFKLVSSGTGSAKYCVVALIVGVVFTALACLLYKNRASEASSRAIVFNRAKLPIKSVLVIIGSLIMMTMLKAITDSEIGAVFGILFGALLTHAIIEIIYEFDFKRAFAKPLHLVILSVICVLVYIIYAFDIFGYDTFIPSESSIASCSVISTSRNDVIRDMIISQKPEIQNGNIVLTYKTDEEILSEIKLTDPRPVLSMAKKGIAHLDPNDDVDTDYDFTVRYKLKDGRSITRAYNGVYPEMEEDIKKIFESDSFKQALMPAEDDYVGVNYRIFGENLHLYGEKDKTETNALLEAYKKDWQNIGYDDYKNGHIACYLQFKSKQYSDLVNKAKEDGYVGNIVNYGYIPVYSGFENTIDILKGESLLVDVLPTADMITQINFYSDKEGGYVTYTEKEDIEKILPYITHPSAVKPDDEEDVSVTVSLDRLQRTLDSVKGRYVYSDDETEAEKVLDYVIKREDLKKLGL